MKILLKSIQGKTCVIDVNENTTILELKRKCEKDLNIPHNQQTIVLYGKTLQDDKTVGSYEKIKDGAKLFVATRKPDTLKLALTRFLKQFYSEQQCTAIVNEFMADFQTKVNNLSLDDLERIAKADMDHSNAT